MIQPASLVLPPPADRIWAGPLAHWTAGRAWRMQLLHPSDVSLIIQVTRGQGRACLGASMHGIGVNTVLYVPQGTVFSFELFRTGAARVMAVSDAAEMRVPEHPMLLRLRDVDEIGGLMGLFDGAIQETSTNRPFRETALDGMGMLMSVWLQRQLLSESAQNFTPASDTLMHRYLERIGQTPAGRASLQDHAQALGVGVTHLSRVCKRAVGKTAAQILRDCVLHTALRLVTETRVPLQDIARHLSYGSAAYFTRVVQERLGASPSSLRTQARQSSPKMSQTDH